jgi:hypothetical protein
MLREEEMIMKKTTDYFYYCYENDTTVEYVDAEHYSMLNVSFTSEDEDAGTETIHSDPAVPAKPMEQMAYEMLQELKEYMDMCDEGKWKDIPHELHMKYDQYMNSTRIAAENALQQIAKDYEPVVRNKDGNLVRIMTVRDAAKLIRDIAAETKDVKVDFGVSVGEQIEDRPLKYYAEHNGDVAWFGVKQIWNGADLFDGTGFDTDYIFIVGHYGGGCISTAYFCSDDYEHITEWDAEELVKAMCESADVDPDEKILVEVIEKKGEVDDE